MPEGDTIHRVALRLGAALVGSAIERAEAPSRRSPLHLRAGELEGRVLEHAEARGKHLLLHFSGDAVVHSHLGMNGRWRIRADGRLPAGRPWLTLAAGRGVATQSQGKLLRLTSAARARNDPVLLELGPDPLAPGFDERLAARRLLGWEPTEQVGAALLDQRLFAGIGNVIRVEACFRAAVSPWRRIDEIDQAEALALVAAVHHVMTTTVREGRRPKLIYGLGHLPCPRCGSKLEQRGQGDDNRTTLWCPSCQR